MDVPKLIEDINAAASSAGSLSENERLELLKVSQGLTSALENPLEATMRICFAVYSTRRVCAARS